MDLGIFLNAADGGDLQQNIPEHAACYIGHSINESFDYVFLKFPSPAVARFTSYQVSLGVVEICYHTYSSARIIWSTTLSSSYWKSIPTFQVVPSTICSKSVLS